MSKWHAWIVLRAFVYPFDTSGSLKPTWIYEILPMGFFFFVWIGVLANFPLTPQVLMIYSLYFLCYLPIPAGDFSLYFSRLYWFTSIKVTLVHKLCRTNSLQAYKLKSCRVRHINICPAHRRCISSGVFCAAANLWMMPHNFRWRYFKQALIYWPLRCIISPFKQTS